MTNDIRASFPEFVLAQWLDAGAGSFLQERTALEIRLVRVGAKALIDQLRSKPVSLDRL